MLFYRLGLTVLFCFSLNACEPFKDGSDKAQRVEEQLQQVLACELEVGFSWSNGHYERVDIVFSESPNINMRELSALSQQIIEAHFGQRPDIVLSVLIKSER